MIDFDDFQRQVGEWGQRTFPHSTPLTVWHHLAHGDSAEVAELHRAIEAGDRDAIMEEAADCLLMLLHIAHKLGLSLHEAAAVKYAICQRRQWGPPDEHGMSRHVS